MSKWYGKIGYAITEETEAGVWEEVIIERNYYGDVVSNRWLRQTSDNINDNINISNTFEILADSFAYNHCSNIAYITFHNQKWKISSIDVQRPRLILTAGGVYNEG